MRKLNLKIFLVSFFALGVIIASLTASEFRIRSLGNARLALADEDNQLNLYNAGNNPAYLLFDEKSNWLKFYTGADYFHTSLKRLYDPEKEQNLYFSFEGVKILGKNQVFLGKVTYTFNRLYRVYRAIEPNPYNDDPLVLTDTTTGSFYTDGPAIRVAYQNQVLPKLGVGVEVDYRISTGLKKQYTRPRTIHRNFAGKVGVTYRFSPDLVWGGYFKGSFLQDQVELERSWDGRTIYTLRYRSESVYRATAGNYDRYINLDGFQLNSAVQFYAHRKKFRNLFELNLFKRQQKITDKFSSKKETDSPWYNYAIGASYQGRYFFNRLIFGLKLAYLYGEDWSEHPDYSILITERHQEWYRVAGGVSYQFPRLLLVSQVGFTRSHIQYDDYQSEVYRKGNHDFYTGKFGLEFRVDPIHFIRAGLNYDYFYPDFLSPRYLPEHSRHYFSMGFSEQRARYDMEIHLEYVFKNQVDMPSRYDGWNAIIYTRIYMPE